jgi:predicted DNA-binding transcriptional regulator AlpA
MITFPANHPIGRQQRENLRDKLLPAEEREELVRLYGELILPTLEKLLDAKIEALASRYEEAWARAFAPLKEADGIRLVTREEAAEMLGVSLSSIQGLEKRGDLPEPERFGSRTVRHKLDDIIAFARGNGLPVCVSPKKQS